MITGAMMMMVITSILIFQAPCSEARAGARLTWSAWGGGAGAASSLEPGHSGGRGAES